MKTFTLILVILAVYFHNTEGSPVAAPCRTAAGAPCALPHLDRLTEIDAAEAAEEAKRVKRDDSAASTGGASAASVAGGNSLNSGGISLTGGLSDATTQRTG